MITDCYDNKTDPVINLKDFYGLELYDFLEAGDVLESSGYDIEGLHGANHNLGKLYVALETALFL